MGSRILNAEFHLPPGGYNFSGRPPMEAGDQGHKPNQAMVYIPGKILSWYGTQTIKCHGIELLAFLKFRNNEADISGVISEEIIWCGHQLVLGAKDAGAQNTLVIQSPAAIPPLGPGWLWVDYQAITPPTTLEENAMWEIQMVVFYE